MTITDIFPAIIKTGKCLYGDIEYRVFICTSNIYPGTGDYEDGLEISKDREISCFCILYENVVRKDEVNSNGGYYLSVSDAVDAVEKNPGFIEWGET